MLRLAAILPTLVWLLFPAGICICECAGLPERDAAPRTSSRPISGHAPWCTANKGNVPYDRAEEEQDDAAPNELALLQPELTEQPLALLLSQQFDTESEGVPAYPSVRLSACLWLE